MAEVVTDQGSEWLAEFHQLLEQALVDHRVTSALRPSSNGASERQVAVVKRALRRRCHDTKVGDQWDEDMPWIMLGINCSAQASTGMLPYIMLLHAQAPTIPPAIKERMDAPLRVEIDSDEAAKQLLQRAKLLQQHCAMAGQNLLIAQHRNTMRYAAVRSGLFKPRERKFDIGDFMYERKPDAEALHMRTRPAICRIKGITPAGVATLQGRCGQCTKRCDRDSICAPSSASSPAQAVAEQHTAARNSCTVPTLHHSTAVALHRSAPCSSRQPKNA